MHYEPINKGKPREFWIDDLHSYEPYIQEREGTMINKPFESCIHVIEKSAYDKAVAERDEWKNKFETRIHRHEYMDSIKQRDQLIKLVSELEGALIEAKEYADLGGNIGGLRQWIRHCLTRINEFRKAGK